jgi:hypothetical protein
MATPETLWQRLLDEAGDDAVESAAAVSLAQAERELATAGFDVKAERARAVARIEELTGEAASSSRGPEPASEPTAWVSGAAPPVRRSTTSRRMVWLAAALVALATAGGLLYAAAHRPSPPDKPVDVPSATVKAPTPPPPAPTVQSPPSNQNPSALPEDLKLAPRHPARTP